MYNKVSVIAPKSLEGEVRGALRQILCNLKSDKRIIQMRQLKSTNTQSDPSCSRRIPASCRPCQTHCSVAPPPPSCLPLSPETQSHFPVLFSVTSAE